MTSASISSTPRCATAPRPRASISGSRTSAIALALDRLGIDYIEGGWPGANPTDDAFFAEPPALKTAKLVAFGMTTRPGPQRRQRSGPGRAAGAAHAGRLPGGQELGFPCRCRAGHRAPGEYRDDRGDRGARRRRAARETMFDAEHFFDGYKANPDYAFDCLQAARAGRRALDRAVRHQWRHLARRGLAHRRRSDGQDLPAASSASMPITTPSRRWRSAWRRCAPARARSRAR